MSDAIEVVQRDAQAGRYLVRQVQVFPYDLVLSFGRGARAQSAMITVAPIRIQSKSHLPAVVATFTQP